MLVCNTDATPMLLTVRLSTRTERAVNALARRRRQTRSDVVRDALEHYAAIDSGDSSRGRPYDAWLDVIGVISVGVREPGRSSGEQFAEIVRAKARARRAR
jgi:hypothetical protein